MAGIVQTARVWGEMIKLSHSIFALPFALLAVFLATRPALPAPGLLLLVLICTVAARSAAMTFNRLVDRHIDASNPRTAQRALPRGTISPRAAAAFFGAALVTFLAGCAGFWWLYANPWPILLALPVLAVLCGYSYAKRFTAGSHLILGIALALAPFGAWLAVNPATLGLETLILMIVVWTWVAGFDVIYACQDFEFDRNAGLHSIPAAMGIAGGLWMARGLHALTIAALFALGWRAQLGLLYYVGASAAALLLIVENAIVSPRDLSRVNMAFFTVNGIVGLVVGALGILDVVGS